MGAASTAGGMALLPITVGPGTGCCGLAAVCYLADSSAHKTTRLPLKFEYKYRVKIVALGTLKQYSIFFLTLYLEWYSAYSILYSGEPH
jgi:hypothetical protein